MVVSASVVFVGWGERGSDSNDLLSSVLFSLLFFLLVCSRFPLPTGLMPVSSSSSSSRCFCP